ncbi:hypothetical protein SCARR_01862 [Pontiella sulfatireligans]|uniref:Uncharacterized protein n=1 Tax=Pontiella sulfatireligans TaxID=2750658 RepID=A0A6C2UHV7_9BACT|nr:hypothetical protein SCARR_01862 [Pontiella sulfatireligans]
MKHKDPRVGALEAFSADECPQLGGLRTRKVLVQIVLGMVNEFYLESHLRQGPIQWVEVVVEPALNRGRSNPAVATRLLLRDAVAVIEMHREAEALGAAPVPLNAVLRP